MKRQQDEAGDASSKRFKYYGEAGEGPASTSKTTLVAFIEVCLSVSLLTEKNLPKNELFAVFDKVALLVHQRSRQPSQDQDRFPSLAVVSDWTLATAFGFVESLPLQSLVVLMVRLKSWVASRVQPPPHTHTAFPRALGSLQLQPSAPVMAVQPTNVMSLQQLGYFQPQVTQHPHTHANTVPSSPRVTRSKSRAIAQKEHQKPSSDQPALEVEPLQAANETQDRIDNILHEMDTMYQTDHKIVQFLESLQASLEKDESGCVAYRLAVLLEMRDGTPQDLALAKQLYDRALPLLFKASESGDARAMTDLGLLLLEVRNEPVQGFKFLSLAAGLSFPYAQLNVAQLYQLGSVVSQDLAKAESLRKQAAESGHAPSQFYYGGILKVAHRLEESVEMFKLAAAQNFSPAAEHLGLAYETGLGVAIDYTTAAKYFLQAASGGCPGSQFKIASFFRDGSGIKKNLEEAKRWFTLAGRKNTSRYSLFSAGKGYPGARECLEELLKKIELECATSTLLAQRQAEKIPDVASETSVILADPRVEKTTPEVVSEISPIAAPEVEKAPEVVSETSGININRPKQPQHQEVRLSIVRWPKNRSLKFQKLCLFPKKHLEPLRYWLGSNLQNVLSFLYDHPLVLQEAVFHLLEHLPGPFRLYLLLERSL